MNFLVNQCDLPFALHNVIVGFLFNSTYSKVLYYLFLMVYNRYGLPRLDNAGLNVNLGNFNSPPIR